ncbi:MAG: flippase [Dechloromonas sp.]|nr:flippase [Candidatus Dechloromonas phosphoritropha]MBP8787182.1 flippase [Azonexus sp.]MBP9227102.1 flippase [Azonexus sp.]
MGIVKISRGLLWSFAGAVLPLLAAGFAIPQLIDLLGVARFGILSLAWIFVGYFSLFDLGLTRALIHSIARRIGRDDETEIPSIVWMGLLALVSLGSVSALLVWGLTPWIVEGKLAIAKPLIEEAKSSFYILAASIPVVVLSTALRSILEARQRFDVVNIIKIPLGILSYLGPLAVLPLSNTLPAMVLVLLVTRVLLCVVYFFVSMRLYPELIQKICFKFDFARELFSFGGWMAISNLTGPLLLYLGRFSLAVMISAEAVAYFSTPYDVIINLLIIPGTFVTVLFPVFTQQFPKNKMLVRQYYWRAKKQISLIMFPLLVSVYIFSEPMLTWWINEDFSVKSQMVAKLLALGVFINSFGHISQALIQAYGRPDITAKLHIVELIAYIPYMTWFIESYGVEGAATAWVLRVFFSTVLLWIFAVKCLNGSIKSMY